jgi:DNA primase
LSKYSKDTPDGKARAASEFFNYIDALQSSVQKTASMEQLCRAFNLNVEAAKRDFAARKSNRKMELENQNDRKVDSTDNQVKIGQELRALFAIISDISVASEIIQQLTEDDFEDSSAKKLFTVLKECSSSGNLSLENILSRCDTELQQPIVETTSVGEFSKNTAKAVQDSFVFLRKRSLERKRVELGAKISSIRFDSDEDKVLFQNLLQEKMNIDKLIETMKG